MSAGNKTVGTVQVFNQLRYPQWSWRKDAGKMSLKLLADFQSESIPWQHASSLTLLACDMWLKDF